MPENDFFGHKLALAWFCGLRSPKAVNGTIPHGWAVDMQVSNRKIDRGPLFVWNERLLGQARSLGVRNVDSIGSPFAYLLRVLWPNGDYPLGRGTLALLPGPGLSIKAVNDFMSSVEEQSPPPYTGVLRFMDWESGIVDLLTRPQWRFVCFGRRSRTDFLVRCALEIAQHSCIAGDSIQTAIWYGALLERHVVLATNDDIECGRSSSERHLNERMRSLWPDVYRGGVSDATVTEVAKHELGWDLNVDRDELSDRLGWNSSLVTARSYLIGSLIDLRIGKKVRQGTLSPLESVSVKSPGRGAI